MSVLTVIKKIGEKIISIVEWPIKQAQMVEELLATVEQDEPEVKAAIVGLVEQFDAIDPDVIAAIAADGFNISEDLKTATDLKSLFSYFASTFVPVVEKAFADLKVDTSTVTQAAPVPVAPAPAADAAPQLSPGPGLHTVNA